MDKLIVFDWGGIIEKFGPGDYTVKDAYLLMLEKMEYDFSGKKIDASIMDFIYELRNTFTIDENIELEKWYNNLGKKYNSVINYNDFIDYYMKYFNNTETNIDTINLIYETSKHYNTALLSNLNMLDIKRLEKQIKLDTFNYLFLSCKLGMKKPDNNIYEHVERVTGTKPKDIIFIDDSKQNTKVASFRGWNVICENGMNTSKIKKKILEFTN